MKFYEIFENPKIYDLNAKIFSFNNKKLRRYLPELINLKADEKILDVGCGTGRYAIFGENYTGVDPSRSYIDYAKANCQGKFILMDGANLEFPDNSFEVVINISIFHHIPDEICHKIIDEMIRVCCPGGRVYITDIVYPPKLNILGNLLFRLDRGDYQRSFKDFADLIYQHKFELISDDIGGTFPYRWAIFSYKK